MSFILDALKKVEKQKSAAGAIRVAEDVLGRGTSGGSRRELLIMVGIAVISASVTAGALWFLGERAPDSENTPVAIEEVAAPEPQAAPVERFLPPLPPEDPPEPTSQKPAQGEAVPNEDRDEGSVEMVAKPPEVPVREEEEPGNVESSSDPPVLVLQGTSVLRGEPVAVINDQRVFEGDRVEGALVIRIEERAVELELDGRRFTIRL
ncbi:MAG TPA: hypothetical protein VEK15_27740 [Vicinamibacteria bacterium]|nr:hypothetical protein [Vicinamibacteria bacterium]